MQGAVIASFARLTAVSALLLSAAILPSAGGALALGQGSGPAPNTLPPDLSRILAHPTLQGARFGFVATLLPEGRRLLSYNADELFAPASVAKLFTTAAALWQLGGHFTWQTPLAYHGDRVGESIRGDLWALGRGAPDLVEERLWLAARAIRELGITRIAGDLVVDNRYFDDERYGEGWPVGNQVHEAYHSPISALMANFAARRGDDGWEAVEEPALHFGDRLKELLAVSDVQIEGIVRPPLPEELRMVPAPAFSGDELGAESVPEPLTHLYTIESEPLGRLVMDINKFSNNVMAESVLKTLGAMEYGAPGTATKGLAVITRFLDAEVRVPVNSFVQADGSGLSRLDRFSPSQVERLLLYAQDDFHIGPELMASLKLSGLDGWNPAAFKHPQLAGELRVKSGHIRGVNTLSGFLHTRSGRTVVFVAMVNGHRAGQWEIDQRMAEIVAFLIREY